MYVVYLCITILAVHNPYSGNVIMKYPANSDYVSVEMHCSTVAFLKFPYMVVIMFVVVVVVAVIGYHKRLKGIHELFVST